MGKLKATGQNEENKKEDKSYIWFKTTSKIYLKFWGNMGMACYIVKIVRSSILF